MCGIYNRRRVYENEVSNHVAYKKGYNDGEKLTIQNSLLMIVYLRTNQIDVKTATRCEWPL